MKDADASGPLKIDVHTHILPKSWPDLRDRYGYGGFVRLDHVDRCSARMMVDDEFFREVGYNCWDAERRLEECDETGVGVQVLSTVPVMFSYWARPRDTHDLSRILNDHVADTISRYPQRFLGLGTLPMQAPDLAIEELERCVRELGLCGVQIGTHINDWNLDAAELFPVFEAASDLGAAVFVHPWDMMGQERMNRYWLPWLVGMPAETSLAICSIIFGGVLERLPDLRICFAHGGGAFPGTVGRIQHGFDVRPDLCAINNSVPPRDYLGRFWVDSLVHDPSALRLLIELMGDNRIVLGSDYPFPLGEALPGSTILTAIDEPAVRERLLGLNAIEFLGVDAELARSLCRR